MKNKKGFYELKREQGYLTTDEFLVMLKKLAKLSNQRLKKSIENILIINKEIGV